MLNGQTALVTGGSRGIGLAVAKELLAAGANVMITARTGVNEAVAALGAGAAGIVCDVADYAQAENAVAATVERFGGLSLLINNAGVIDPIGPLADSDPASWALNIQINLNGVYHMARAALPGMIAVGGGAIVNVSSGAAHRPLDGWSAYCSGKAGVAMMTKALHLETNGQGIRTFGFAPGTVDTDMQVKIRASGINQISQIPRENLGGVQVPAQIIAYLCSDAAADLSGEELAISDNALRQRAGLSSL